MPWRLIVASDSAFRAQDPDCLALKAAIAVVAPCGERLGGKVAILDWYSKKQSLVCRSTFGAELLALADGSSFGLFLQGLLEELQEGPCSAQRLLEQQRNGQQKVSLDVVVDARAVYAAVTAVEIKPPSEKHLWYQVRALRDLLEAKTIRYLAWADTVDMLCDCLTKGGVNRDRILKAWEHGVWHVGGDPPLLWRAKGKNASLQGSAANIAS